MKPQSDHQFSIDKYLDDTLPNKQNENRIKRRNKQNHNNK